MLKIVFFNIFVGKNQRQTYLEINSNCTFEQKMHFRWTQRQINKKVKLQNRGSLNFKNVYKTTTIASKNTSLTGTLI